MLLLLYYSKELQLCNRCETFFLKLQKHRVFLYHQNLILDYLEKEHMDKLRMPLNNNFTKHVMNLIIPTQRNGIDCGLFVLKYADYICRNAKMDFTQDDMVFFRKRTVPNHL